MSIKDVLKKQTSIPESIEKQLPAVAPKISKILYAVADSLPNISNPKIGHKSKTPKLREFVSSIEEKMPNVFPRFVPETEPCSPCAESKTQSAPLPRSRATYGVDKRGTINLTEIEELL